jgi:hypothetical protein
MQAKDVVKIDAEGIEANLLYAASDLIKRDKPTLVIEVLPEAENLGTVISNLAAEVGYKIHIVPAYRSDKIVQVSVKDFTSRTPGKYHSKDVVLSLRDRLLP